MTPNNHSTWRDSSNSPDKFIDYWVWFVDPCWGVSRLAGQQGWLSAGCEGFVPGNCEVTEARHQPHLLLSGADAGEGGGQVQWPRSQSKGKWVYNIWILNTK